MRAVRRAKMLLEAIAEGRKARRPTMEEKKYSLEELREMRRRNQMIRDAIKERKAVLAKQDKSSNTSANGT